MLKLWIELEIDRWEKQWNLGEVVKNRTEVLAIKTIPRRKKVSYFFLLGDQEMRNLYVGFDNDNVLDDNGAFVMSIK